MKNKLFVILAAALLATLSGCTKSQNGTTAAHANSPQAVYTVEQCAQWNHYSQETIEAALENNFAHELLIQTIECGDVTNFKRLISTPEAIDYISKHIHFEKNYFHSEKTLLMYAAYQGNAEIVKLLLDAGFKGEKVVFFKDVPRLVIPWNEPFEPLLAPTRHEMNHGYYDSNYYLNTRESKEFRYTALHYAVLGSNSAEIVKILIDTGALEKLEAADAATLLELAIGLEKLDVVELLVNAGVPVTNFHLDVVAASTGNVELYKYLRAHLASEIDEFDMLDDRIDEACVYGRPSILEYLIELYNTQAGQNDEENYEIQFCMSEAISGENAEVLQYLLDYGATWSLYHENLDYTVDLSWKQTVNDAVFDRFHPEDPMYPESELYADAYNEDDIKDSDRHPYECTLIETGILNKELEAGGIPREVLTKALVDQFDTCSYTYNTQENWVKALHVKQLLDAGADPFVKKSYDTLLAYAFENGYYASARHLMEAMLSEPSTLNDIMDRMLDSDIGQDDDDDKRKTAQEIISTVLSIGTAQQNYEFIQKLTQASIHLPESINYDEDTLAHMLVQGLPIPPSMADEWLIIVARSSNDNAPEALRRLIKAGANVNAERGAALQKALEHKQEANVLTLLEAGADATHTIVPAVENCNSIRTLKALIRAGANVNEENQAKQTALFIVLDNLNYAREQNDLQLETFQFLLKAGADINHQDIDHASVLDYALTRLQYHAEIIIPMLLKAGANVNAQNDKGYTPLMHVLREEVFEPKYPMFKPLYWKGKENLFVDVVLKPMLKAGIDINHQAKDGVTALYLAANNQYLRITIMDYLLKAGADINLKDDLGDTPLHQVVKNTQLRKAQFLIQAGANVNAQNAQGETPLFYAQTTDMAQMLINAGADIHLINDFGATPLMHYIQRYIPSEPLDIIKLLIETGADINTKNADGLSPLNAALQKSKDDIAKLLIEKGADVNATDKNGETSLWYILKRYWNYNFPMDIFKLVIEKGADVNIKNNLGETPLFELINTSDNISYLKFEERLTLLLKEGADINARDNSGNTPLMFLSKKHNSNNNLIFDDITDHPDFQSTYAFFSLLVKNNADINIRDNDGNTPLHSAIKRGNSILSEMMINLGADINLRDVDGNTALMLAIMHHKDSLADYLIEAGASLNTQNNSGSTVLIYAIIDYNFKLDEMITAGANIHIQDNYGLTPLSWAALMGNEKALEGLIKAGADVNAKDHQNNTPLMLAIREDASYQCVKALINAGAVVNAVTPEGLSILSLALKRNHLPQTINLLREAGAKEYGSLVSESTMFYDELANSMIKEFSEDEDQEEEDYEEEEESEDEGDCYCGDCGSEVDKETLLLPSGPEKKRLTITGPYYLNKYCQNFPGIAGCKY